MIGRLPTFLEPPAQAGEWERLWQQATRGEHISDFETTRRAKDGSEVDVSVSMFPIRDDARNVIGWCKIARDISERKRAEIRFEALLEAAPDAIVAVDAEARIVLVNRRVEDIFGFERRELLGKSIQLLVPEGLRRNHERLCEDYMRSPRPRTKSDGKDLRAVRKDGTEFPAEITLSPIPKGPHDVLVIAAIRDVSDRNRMREQLIVSDRMVSIGTLAAGVAHEINNPLAAVTANLDMALEDVAALVKTVEGAVTIGEELRDAREGAERVRQIVRDLRIFSRSDEDSLHPVDVRRVMESTLRMAWNEIRHRARLVKEYGTVPLVRASDSRLGQVFLNIVVNAAQAIPMGRAESNEIRVTTSVDTSGAVVVAIADTGPGIPPEVLKRLFTPFFTTKPIGQGTGLGLPICQRLVTSLVGRSPSTARSDEARCSESSWSRLRRTKNKRFGLPPSRRPRSTEGVSWSWTMKRSSFKSS